MLTALLAAVTLTAPSTAVAASTAGGGVPATIALSRGWQYAPDPGIEGVARHWQQPGARAGWRSVTVPHVFQARPLASDFRGSVGWYRLRVTAPAAAGFGWGLRFEQVRR